MSTIAVNAITDASGGNTASINGATPTTDNLMGRNRIINGDMRIDQRNAGASVTPTSSSYTLDRYYCFMDAASKYSVQQSSTAPAGFTNSMLFTSTSAYIVGSGEVFGFAQFIEGFNVADLGWGTADAKTVTLSFWVRSSLTGTFGGAFQNSANNRSYPFTYTISSANTWEQKSVTIAGDTTGTWLTNNGKGITLRFSLGASSTASGTAGSWAAANYYSATGATSVVGTNGATFYITGVQLEAGSVATSFERRHYGQELALCQRYFQKVDYRHQNGGVTANWYLYNIPFLVAMRAAPSLVAATAYNIDSGTAEYYLTGPPVANGWVLESASPTATTVRGNSASVTQGLKGRGWFDSEL
jgi:hypothetical protein